MAKNYQQSLPDDIDALKQLILERDRSIESFNKSLVSRDKKIAILEEYVRYLKFKRFGKSSKRFETDGQESLFNEAEQLDESIPQEDETIEITADADQSSSEIESSTDSKKAAPGRRKLPATLPRFKVIHELPVENRLCSCGCELQAFDEVISEQLGIIPAELYVIQHGRKKYRCNACVDKAPITAPMPEQIYQARFAR
jgi:transposase